MPYREDTYKLEEAGKWKKWERRGRFTKENCAYVFFKRTPNYIMNLDR